MKGIVLAAGRGSRMGRATADGPKCLTPLLGRPLIEWQLSALCDAGVDEVAVVTGYKSEALASYGSRRFHNFRWESTNMVQSLACASDWLDRDTCIVSYSDIVYAPAAVVGLLECDAPLAVAYDPTWLSQWTARFADPLSDAESFRIDDDGNVVEIGQPVVDVSDVQGQYMGLLRIAPAGWSEMRRSMSILEDARRLTVDMTTALQLVIAEGHVRVRGVQYEGRWAEIDSASDVAYATEVMGA
jgi:choline kinase